MKNYNKIQVRFTHPNLYRSIMTFALINIGLGLNFIFTKPTFNPYMFDRHITGSIFLLLGFGKLFFLNFSHNLRIVRRLMALEIIFMIFWGIGTSITYFQGKTSLQLFCLYMGLSVIEIFLLNEPILNTLTRRRLK